MNRYWPYIAIVLVGVALALAWLAVHRGDSELSYKVKLEQEFLPEALQPQCRARLVVLEVTRPGPTTDGLQRAVEDYLGKAPPADLFSFLVQFKAKARAESARFIAVGERFGGRLEAVPELIRRLAAVGKTQTEVGKSGPYTLYRVED